jgi:hypothetical protein
MDPDAPLVVLPVLTTTFPLMPELDPIVFAVPTVTAPLEVSALEPELMLTEPPVNVAPLLKPAASVIAPPSRSPLPTESPILPAVPATASPVEMDINPELPVLDAPVANVALPVTPAALLSMDDAVVIDTRPLDCCWLAPDVMVTSPPSTASVVVDPAVTVTAPPAPLSPSPTESTMLPPPPPAVVPVLTVTEPDLPSKEDPVPMDTDPLGPTPAPSAVVMVTAPLVVPESVTPAPDVRAMEPPVDPEA